MKYLFMLTDIEGEWDKLPAGEQGKVMAQHAAVEKELRAEGKYHTCGRLGPAKAAKTMRLRQGGGREVTDGASLVLDGAFAASREIMGGYYIIEAESMDEAVRWAHKIPMAYCSMEIRELFEE